MTGCGIRAGFLRAEGWARPALLDGRAGSLTVACVDHPDEPEPRRPGAVLGVLVGYLVVLLGGAAAVLSVPNASFRAAAAGASVVLLAVLSWAAERLWVGGTGAARRELLGVFAASTLMLVALGALPA